MYPVQYGAQWIERHSRLTTFFRLILAIPAAIFATLYSFVAAIAVIVVWFVMIFTGRYPEGLYRFVSGAVRNYYRFMGYSNLVTDAYPPFHGNDDEAYPVRITFGPPLEQYSRLKALFRFILAIPVMIIAYIFQLIYEVGAIAAWVVIVITGKMPKGLQEIIDMGLRYTVRAHAYYWLLTETWPPLTEPDAPAPASYQPPVMPSV